MIWLRYWILPQLMTGLAKLQTLTVADGMIAYAHRLAFIGAHIKCKCLSEYPLADHR